MKQFLKRLTGFSMGTILGALISLIQVPVLSYFISPAEYGRAGLFRSLIVQIPLIIYFGLDQAYSREYHNFDNKRYLMQQSMILPTFIAVLASILFVFFDESLSQWIFQSPDYAYIIWISCIWIIITIIERFILLSIRMEEKARMYSFYTLMIKVFNFATAMFLILIGMRNFTVIVYSMLFGQILANVIIIFNNKEYLHIQSFTVNHKLIKDLFKFGFPQMVATSLISSLYTISNIFLNNYSTSDELGIFNITLTIVSLIGILRTAFNSFWLPTAYRWESENKDIKHYKFISDSALLVLTIFFYLLLIFKPVILLFIGSGYANAQYIIGIMSLPPLLSVLSEITTLGILFSKKTYYNIFIAIITFSVNVIFNLFLTPHLGFRGAAIASLFAYLTFYLGRTYFSKYTGFYFSQKKSLISIFLMILAALVNSINSNIVIVITIILFLFTLLFQITTFKDMKTIKNDTSGSWDFS